MIQGIWYAVIAYTMWGVLAIYWKWVGEVPATQLLGHRIAWAFVILSLVLGATGRWKRVIGLARQWHVFKHYLLASGVVTVNWLTYVWAVNAGFVVETSLGYFINPLFSVALGVVLLKERLRPWQWLPIGLATLGVLHLTFVYGELPWIALTLAFSFGSYGLLKKKAPLSALDGLALETGILFVPAVVYLCVVESQGHGQFLHGPWILSLGLVGTGLVTLLPLLFFAAATQRIPLSLVGILQYIAPTLQCLVGVYVFHETIGDRLLGFIFVWVALLIFVVEQIVYVRRHDRSRARDDS
ncbi:MAG: EamA family transporter RarD [Planctomycetes bacterium]|nr:EamA family transporter RarD [Planctomycetota bacterium]